MSHPAMRVFVQARMSSARFPGKVLAPLHGRPIIRHVLESVRGALPDVNAIVATSEGPSDDPLVAYLATLDVRVFRGALDDVLDRFQRCLAANPCDWVLRVNADSPWIDAGMLRRVSRHSSRADVDLVTTIFPRTWPKGQNAELIRADTLASLNAPDLTAGDREHVTPFMYRHPDRFRIVNVASDDPSLADTSLAVDTIEDLRRLEQMATADRGTAVS